VKVDGKEAARCREKGKHNVDESDSSPPSHSVSRDNYTEASECHQVVMVDSPYASIPHRGLCAVCLYCDACHHVFIRW